jgi:hypothetical protein
MADDEYDDRGCDTDDCIHEHKKDGLCQCCINAKRGMSESYITADDRAYQKAFRDGERAAIERVADVLEFSWSEKDGLHKTMCEDRGW